MPHRVFSKLGSASKTGINIAQNVSPWLAPSGSRIGRLSSSIPSTSTYLTVPEEIAAITYYNKEAMYDIDILFEATSGTLRTIAADPKYLGAEIGFFAVLHSWGQNLMFHPHLHCVVPGGGLSPDRTCWIPCRRDFFLPVRVLSSLFRRLFLQLLERAFDNGQLQFFSALQPLQDRQNFSSLSTTPTQAQMRSLRQSPFAEPQQVLAYGGRYIHRVAISNNRLLNIDHGQVQFGYKDYRNDSQPKTMTLSADEFIRRFLLHVLFEGFERIRYFGFLANRYRKEKLHRCRQLLGTVPLETSSTEEAPKDYGDRYEDLTGSSLWECPLCHRGRMIVIAVIQSFARSVLTDTS
jgi:hypothetical protein